MFNDFRNRLKQGETLLGVFLTLPSPETAEIFACAGYDWICIDVEHSPMDAKSAQLLLQAAGRDFPCLLRLQSTEDVYIKKALDIGAAGVIVPFVNRVEDARRVVASCKYPPEGERGVGVGRAHGYAAGFAEYLSTANDHISVIIQAEHIDAVNRIEEIVRVPGIDAVLCGPFDLSASMGKPGRIDDTDVKEALVRVKEACRDASLPVGIFCPNPSAAKGLSAEGFTLIACGTDTMILVGAVNESIAALKDAVGRPTS